MRKFLKVLMYIMGILLFLMGLYSLLVNPISIFLILGFLLMFIIILFDLILNEERNYFKFFFTLVPIITLTIITFKVIF